MRLSDHFAAQFAALTATRTARAYLAGLFAAPPDLSDRSLVLTYAEVRSLRDLVSLQALGDWVLWVDAVHPEAQASYRALAHSLGRASYYRCYRLVPEWRVYEELADCLPGLVVELQTSMRSGSRRPSSVTNI